MITAAKIPSLKKTEVRSPGPTGLRFRSILAATDCSPASECAVKLAARLAKQFHARLYVLHAVAPEIYAVNLYGPVPELEWMDLERARKDLHAYAEHLAELRTVKHQEIVFPGSASDGIQAAGKAHDIDLLVLGSHGRQGLAKLALGSVAEWAIRRLTYPVLVAGPACDRSMLPMRSILLATDLGEDAGRCAEYAGSLGQDFTSNLTVLTVLSGEEGAEKRADVKRKICALLPSDCSDHCSLKVEMKSGEVAPAILEAAREHKANLLVLGATRRPPLTDHRPRTKLSAIIRGCHCPVLVVPAHSPEPPSKGERKMP